VGKPFDCNLFPPTSEDAPLASPTDQRGFRPCGIVLHAIDRLSADLEEGQTEASARLLLPGSDRCWRLDEGVDTKSIQLPRPNLARRLALAGL